MKTLAGRTVSLSINYLDQSPNANDKKVYKKYAQLATQQPTSKNYDKYYQLACALWELNKLHEAEQMFLNIIKSTEKHYATTYYHSSDVRGDTTTNIYGYGSYTSSYKNSAAIYLTRIYILNKQYNKAYKYLEDAVKKYKITYNCGTGYHMQKEKYDFLYARCYEGLKQYDKVLELLLPESFDSYDEVSVRVIKKLYSKNAIRDYLNKAENSIQCTFDTFPSFSYVTSNFGSKTAKTDTLTYYSGSATINLFNKTVEMPRPDLENGEKATKEHFIREFKESSFYLALAEVAGLAEKEN
ncbi:tetratricopeptide repeat protein [Niastella vici]|uniref:tetratricopeptide repeat protein n=1 Tax=Niastella vici TaxID=1703345 RepID=UPI00117E6F98|nr:hypothetical protein [Niastella vici]